MNDICISSAQSCDPTAAAAAAASFTDAVVYPQNINGSGGAPGLLTAPGGVYNHSNAFPLSQFCCCRDGESVSYLTVTRHGLYPLDYGTSIPLKKQTNKRPH